MQKDRVRLAEAEIILDDERNSSERIAPAEIGRAHLALEEIELHGGVRQGELLQEQPHLPRVPRVRRVVENEHVARRLPPVLLWRRCAPRSFAGPLCPSCSGSSATRRATCRAVASPR